MSLRKIKLDNQGFTLIELMVTVVLIALVVTTVYTMMSAGNRIFAQGDAKADIQSNLRVSANFISDQIRYASDVQILDAVPADMTAGTTHYIYEEDGILKYYDGSTVRVVPGLLKGVTASLLMEDNNTQSVRIKITGVLRDQTYEVDTAAFLLNIGTDVIPEGIGSVIAFSPGIPVIADANARPITKITIDTDPVGIMEVPLDSTVALTADVEPTDASRKTVKWYLDPAVTYATVESTSATTGLLKFIGSVPGDTANVRAVAMDGSGVEADFPILISVTGGAIVPGTTVTVKSDHDYDRIFKRNGELQMIAEVTPESASSLDVAWTVNPSGTSATIGDDGVLRTTGTNSSSGPLVVTATLETGESDTKSIDIIDNITGAVINEVTSSNSGGKYSGKIKCTLNPGGNSAIPTYGAAKVEWNIGDKVKCNVTKKTENPDGTLDLIVTQTKKNASFSILATVTPLSGNGVYSNKIIIYINNNSE